MASPPPFQVEDQTDEDFFDKLVDDDEFGGSLSDPPPPPLPQQQVEEDVDAKAFSSLTEVAEAATATASASEEQVVEEEAEKHSLDTIASVPEKDILVSEESVSLVSNENTGSKTTGIKEVQWSLFHADSVEKSGNGFGSYSDLFADLGETDNALPDPFANVGTDSDPSLGILEKNVANPDLSTSISYVQPQPESSSYAQPQRESLSSVQPEAEDVSMQQVIEGQDTHNTQYWENMYPGWKYDHNTGEWVQVEGYVATENSVEFNTQATANQLVSNHNSEVSYLQQIVQSVSGSVAEGCTTASVSTWNQVQQDNTQYPPHMLFDPQYPGWYYDTIAQEWRALDSCTSALQSANTTHSQGLQSGNDSTGLHIAENEHSYDGDWQVGRYGSQPAGGQEHTGDWAGLAGNYGQQSRNTWQSNTVGTNDAAGYADTHQSDNQSVNMWRSETAGNNNVAAGHTGIYQTDKVTANIWQPEAASRNDGAAGYTDVHQSNKQHVNMWRPQTVGNIDVPAGYTDIQQTDKQTVTMWRAETVGKNNAVGDYFDRQQSDKFYGSRDPANNVGFSTAGSTSFYELTNRSNGGNDAVNDFTSSVSSNFPQQLHHSRFEQSPQTFSVDNFYGRSGDHSQQMFQNRTQLPYNQKEERSSAGRPPHSLATFGFGGKLIVMKECCSSISNSTYGRQDSVGGAISVLDVMDVVADKTDATIIGLGVSDYFRALCRQSFPGPLVGGSGSRELNKWIDDRIANCESPNMDYRKRELLRLLLSLLKIASQHYGKLRSPFGTDPSLRESDRPEAAVAKLFASAKRNGGYGAVAHCLQNVPEEVQIRATAAEVQNFLVSGRTKEALQCAQEGQLWGPALILAAQLGDQFYVDTVKQLAHRQLVAGSPLRTLCLLIAGQPADVFSADSNSSSGPSGVANVSQVHPQIGCNGMLDDWEENLAIISANRTKGDELVILHLGDCLWKEKGEITAAHICYLVAEANFESFSDSARLCLLGADHWKYPRTYASPEAIQRTEFYEYSMQLGNSQSILLPFQPYKLIYAYMLAEVGRLSDSLKYCQALLKSLKTGRAPEVDAWKQMVSTLEERIKTQQQSGFGTNIVSSKVFGNFNKLIGRMVGGPPRIPSGSGHEQDSHPVGSRVANSQSTMAMSSLMPSESTEPISAWGGGNRSMHNRSISEPDFGRTPRQGDPSKETSSSDIQGKSSDSGGPSRFGRIGSTLFQKTMGWVSRSRPDRQAKLGEKNKFYYDENLKRWVEEGAEPPAEESAPPPPPTTAAFQNGMADYNTKSGFKGESSHANGGLEVKSPTHSERSPGIPPIPPSSNQFSARGRMGVRSRYVDTFNKDKGATANFFQSPSISATKPGSGGNAKFFVPTPTSSVEQTVDGMGENMVVAAVTNEDQATFMAKNSFSSPPNSFSSPPNSFSSPNMFSYPPQLSSSSMQRFPSMNNITPSGSQRMGAPDNGYGPLSSRSRRTASWSGSFNPESLNPAKGNEIKPLGEALGMPLSSFMSSDQSSMPLQMNGGGFAEDLQEVEL